MQWNKKSAYMLAGLTFLLGSIGAIGLQVHAQQSSAPTPPTPAAQIQNQPVQNQPATASEQENSVTDKTDVQEQQDPKDNGESESTLEQEDSKKTENGVEVNDNLSRNGHQDQAGDDTDNRFEGKD